jgi:hypothetical protein
VDNAVGLVGIHHLLDVVQPVGVRGEDGAVNLRRSRDALNI